MLSFIFNFRLYFRESFQIFKDYFEKLEWIVKWKQYKIMKHWRIIWNLNYFSNKWINLLF